MSLEELIIRHALNLPIGSVRREAAASGVMMIPVPAAGVLLEVRGPREGARKLQASRRSALRPKYSRLWFPGRRVPATWDLFFARAALPSSPAEVEAALRTAHSKLQFVISPALPVVR